MYGFVRMSMGTHGGWKRVSEPLELELQAFVSHLIWVLGTKLRSQQEQYVLLTVSHLSNPQNHLCNEISPNLEWAVLEWQ